MYDNTQGVWVTTGTPDTSGLHAWTNIPTNGGTSVSWSYSVTLSTTNHAYNVIARAVDAAGNISAYTTSYCTIEISPSKPSDIPQSAVIAAQFPGASSYISNLAVITGTSYSPSNEYVTDVKYALKRLKDSLWWNWIPNGHVGTFIGNTGEVWNDTCTLSGQSSQPGWQILVSSINSNLTNGTSYSIYTQANDSAGNYQQSYTTFTFTWVVNAPTSTITFPVYNNGNPTYTSSWPVFTGNCYDTGAGIWKSSGTVKILLQSLNQGNTYWYNGSWHNGLPTNNPYDVLDNATVWPPTSVTAANGMYITVSSWTYQYTGALTPGATYIFMSIAGDSAVDRTRSGNDAYGHQLSGNYQNSWATGANGSSITFICDGNTPSINITVPTPGANTTWRNDATMTIQGTASDAWALSSSSGIYISVQDLGTGMFITTGTIDASGYHAWTLMGWGGTPSNAGTGSVAWSYTINASSWTANHKFQAVAMACNASGVFSTTYSTAVFVYDKPYVTGTYQYPNSNFVSPTKGVYVCNLNTITGTAAEDTNCEIQQVRYAIKDLHQNLWWDWTYSNHLGGFSGTGEVLNSTCTLSILNNNAPGWTVIVSTINNSLVTGTTYALYTQAEDFGNNFETNYDTITFLWDVAKPTSSIFFPVYAGVGTSYTDRQPTFYGNCGDVGAGIWPGTWPTSSGTVKILLQDITQGSAQQGQYWYGGAWHNNLPSVTNNSYDGLDSAVIGPVTVTMQNGYIPVTQSSWTYQFTGLLNPGDQYVLAAIAGDAAIDQARIGYPGNYENVVVGVSSFVFTCDGTPGG